MSRIYEWRDSLFMASKPPVEARPTQAEVDEALREATIWSGASALACTEQKALDHLDRWRSKEAIKEMWEDFDALSVAELEGLLVPKEPSMPDEPQAHCSPAVLLGHEELEREMAWKAMLANLPSAAPEVRTEHGCKLANYLAKQEARRRNCTVAARATSASGSTDRGGD
jgi:hypothetical protein